MSGFRGHELPADKRAALRRARRLEQLSIAYLITALIFVGLALGSSQAMKAALFEDMLSLLPPIAFLVAVRIRRKPASPDHPWGHHRAPGVAYLASSVALLGFGGWILIDSVMKLVMVEHPPIGTVVIGGEQFWQGWLMLAALAYSGIPPVFLGRAKEKVARELHDKVLYADAEMNRADWMTAGAAAIGVIGIGLGLWYADAAAGAVIATDIVRDGWRNLRRAVDDLMDARPATVDSTAPHPLNREARDALLALGWVQDAVVRLREAGHVLTGEALVVPVDGDDLLGRVEEAERVVEGLSWQLQDITVSPVRSLDEHDAAMDGARGVPAEA